MATGVDSAMGFVAGKRRRVEGAAGWCGLAAERRMHSAAELWAGSAVAAKLRRSRRSQMPDGERRGTVGDSVRLSPLNGESRMRLGGGLAQRSQQSGDEPGEAGHRAMGDGRWALTSGMRSDPGGAATHDERSQPGGAGNRHSTATARTATGRASCRSTRRALPPNGDKRERQAAERQAVAAKRQQPKPAQKGTTTSTAAGTGPPPRSPFRRTSIPPWSFRPRPTRPVRRTSGPGY